MRNTPNLLLTRLVAHGLLMFYLCAAMAEEKKEIKVTGNKISNSVVIIVQGESFDLTTKKGFVDAIETINHTPELKALLEQYLAITIEVNNQTQNRLTELAEKLPKAADLQKQVESLVREKEQLMSELSSLRVRLDVYSAETTLLAKAETALAEHDPDLARQLLENVKNMHRETAKKEILEAARLTVIQARIYYSQANYTNAVSQMGLALRDDPENVGYLVLYGDYAVDNGQYADGREKYERALSLIEKGFVAGTNTLGAVIVRVGIAEWQEKRFNVAEKHFREALVFYDEDDEKKAGVFSQLAIVLRDEDQLTNALSAAWGAVETFEKTSNREGLGEAYGHYGLINKDLGNYPEAEKYYQKSLAITKELYGTNHFYAAIDLNNLGTLYREMGKFEEAEDHLRQALGIDEKNFRAEHPFIGRDKNNLGLVLIDLHKFSESESLLKDALAITEATYGPENRALINRYNNLGYLYNTWGKYDLAWKNLSKAEIILKNYSLDGNTTAIPPFKNIGEYYVRTRDKKKALEYLKRAEALAKRLAPDHPVRKRVESLLVEANSL